MAEKLKKVEKDYYTLYDSDGDIVASNNPKTPTTKKLSLKNCQAIENGYDLDELAVLSTKDETTILGNQKMAQGFIKGFQKAIEILGDKKFSLEDMKKVYLNSSKYEWFGDCIKSLQQTEWDVEIEMECVMGCQNLILNGENSVCCGDKKPKLDSDGCLILKRK